MEYDLFSLRNELDTRGILICFNGPFTHGVIEELGKAIKRYLESEELEKGVLMDVFSVYIELTQNMKNYAEKNAGVTCDVQPLGYGTMAIAKVNSKYCISSGNIIKWEHMEMLRDRLEAIIPLDKKALRAVYKEQLRKELAPGQTSAGLGFLDMARKATEPLKYTFKKIDDHCGFFSLNVLI